MEVRSERLPWPIPGEKRIVNSAEITCNGSDVTCGGNDVRKQLAWPSVSEEKTAMSLLSIPEIFYLWQLAGGDVVTELRKHGLMVSTPPVISVPTIVTKEGQSFGQLKQRAALYDQTVILLPLSQLENCLSDIP